MPFEVIPAIDVYHGRLARLSDGARETEPFSSDDLYDELVQLGEHKIV